jgi:hypothetical protein
VGADKVILLSRTIRSRYLQLAREKGERKGGYSRFIDLRKTPEKLPALLFCGGIHNGIHKLQFVGVAQLGLSRVREIASQIFGDLRFVRISRIDWCVDLWGISVLDFALYCRLTRAQNCKVVRSRSGISFYLGNSKQRVLLIYDRLARLQAIRDPLAEYYSTSDQITRVEVQLRGRGLPYRRLRDIERYGELDLLSRLSFWEIKRTNKKTLRPIEVLAAEGLLYKIDRFGLQATAKMFASQAWAYLQGKFLTPASKSEFLGISTLMKNSIRDWLEDRIRFPRLTKRSRS